jgi:hypothetical protein
MHQGVTSASIKYIQEPTEPSDYPKDFDKGKHKDDYILVPHPIIPEYIMHNHRMLLRISWKTPNGYLPMTFRIVTLYPEYMAFCPEAEEAIRKNGLLRVDDGGKPFVRVHRGGSEGHLFDSAIQSSGDQTNNILGLGTVAKLGLHTDTTGYRFNENVAWF